MTLIDRAHPAPGPPPPAHTELGHHEPPEVPTLLPALPADVAELAALVPEDRANESGSLMMESESPAMESGVVVIQKWDLHNESENAINQSEDLIKESGYAINGSKNPVNQREDLRMKSEGNLIELGTLMIQNGDRINRSGGFVNESKVSIIESYTR